MADVIPCRTPASSRLSMSFLSYNLFHFKGNLHKLQSQFNFVQIQGTVKVGQQHEGNDVLPNDEFSRERHLLGRWRLWDNFLPEVTHLFLLNLCL